MDNKRQFYFLIPLVLLLTIINLILFYLIFGESVLVIIGIMIFLILIVLFYFFYQHKSKIQKTHPKLIINQEQSLENETAISNLQSQTFKALDKPRFILQKRILIIEIVIIFLLIMNLIIKLYKE